MKISVVMPSYNQGRFIREAIDSVLQFDHLDLELLVMDGGSTDETVSVLESYGDRFAWVSEPDDGQSWAINEGLNRASGDILCWLNSDDLFEPGALDAVLETFASDPELQFVYGRGMNVEEDGSPIGDSGVQPFTLWELIHRRNFLHQPSCFWTRSAWHEHGGLVEDLHYVMDWDLWIRLGSLPNRFLDRSLSLNRAYDDNKTMSGGFARWKEIRRICAGRAEGRRPDVLRIYGYEAAIQRLRAKDRSPRLQRRLSDRFMAEMHDRSATGWGQHGAMRSTVKVTVGQFDATNDEVALTIAPLAMVDPELAASVRFTWSSHRGDRGSFVLDATHTGPQTFRLRLANADPFQHLTIRTDTPGVALPDAPPVVAYLDRVARVPRAAADA